MVNWAKIIGRGFKPKTFKWWEDRFEVEVRVQKYVLTNYKVKMNNNYACFFVEFERELFATEISNEILVSAKREDREEELLKQVFSILTDTIMMDVFDNPNKIKKCKVLY